MQLVDDNALAMILGLGGIKTPGPRLSTNIEDWRGEDAKMFSPTPMAQDPSLGMAYSPPYSSGTAANSDMAMGAGVNDIDTAAARATMHQPVNKVWRDLPAPGPQSLMSNPIIQGLGQPVQKVADEQGRGSDMEGPYTPLTPEEHEALMYDTPVVSSKIPHTPEDIQDLLDTPQEEWDQHFNELKKQWGNNLVNPAPNPAGRIRGWKSIPGFQEYMKNLPPDVTVHDMKDGTIIFQKKQQKPVPTS